MPRYEIKAIEESTDFIEQVILVDADNLEQAFELVKEDKGDIISSKQLGCDDFKWVNDEAWTGKVVPGT